MNSYVGLDVSLKETSVCIVDQDGVVVKEGAVLSDPDLIGTFIREHGVNVRRVGLETGPTSTWLWHEFQARGLPVICIDARHAKAALSMQINKSDRNDAAGIARIMQAGWYREVQVKSLDSHGIRAMLNSRAMLVKMKRDLENQIRGLLKNVGLVIGRGKGTAYTVRVEELLKQQSELGYVIRPLLVVRESIERQFIILDRQVKTLARRYETTRLLMTVPGVGPITALAFMAGIDDPSRFRRSRSVGAYCGLTPRRYASGEIDWSGRISKCGDTMLRTCLFEAAGALLTRTQKWCALKAWGLRLAKRVGMKKAKVAVARKLAIILHRMWRDGTSFCWTRLETNA